MLGITATNRARFFKDTSETWGREAVALARLGRTQPARQAAIFAALNYRFYINTIEGFAYDAKRTAN